jgi:UDP-N-acetylmuramate dehydrogenase
MNAGGHGSDTSKVLIDCSSIDLAAGGNATETVRSVAELDFSYRRSAVTASQVVVRARFRLTPGDREASAQTIDEIVRWRREHQPGGQNAGSVFTNPPGDSAGRLIDAAGLKGHRRGTAQVSEKHANFIQADDGGSADDVYALIQEVQQVVETRTGIRLAVELHTVGFVPLEAEPSSLDRGLVP